MTRDGSLSPHDEDDAAPAGNDDEDTSGSHTPRHSVGRTVLEWLAVVACGVLIALTAQEFVVQAFWIPSPSMTPTLDVDDRVLVNKLAYRTHDVHRGDLVVFERPPQASDCEGSEIKDLIKRVVAVGGDTVAFTPDGHLVRNGEELEEDYILECPGTCGLPMEITVPPGHYFVAGDNRPLSSDSRSSPVYSFHNSSQTSWASKNSQALK